MLTWMNRLGVKVAVVNSTKMLDRCGFVKHRFTIIVSAMIVLSSASWAAIASLRLYSLPSQATGTCKIYRRTQQMLFLLIKA